MLYLNLPDSSPFTLSYSILCSSFYMPALLNLSSCSLFYRIVSCLFSICQFLRGLSHFYLSLFVPPLFPSSVSLVSSALKSVPFTARSGKRCSRLLCDSVFSDDSPSQIPWYSAGLCFSSALLAVLMFVFSHQEQTLDKQLSQLLQHTGLISVLLLLYRLIIKLTARVNAILQGLRLSQYYHLIYAQNMACSDQNKCYET